MQEHFYNRTPTTSHPRSLQHLPASSSPCLLNLALLCNRFDSFQAWKDFAFLNSSQGIFKVIQTCRKISAPIVAWKSNLPPCCEKQADRPTDRQTNRQTDWVIGNLHFQIMIFYKMYLQ